MAESLDASLIYEILKDVQARLARMEGMRDEMREGFASIRAHTATQTICAGPTGGPPSRT